MVDFANSTNFLFNLFTAEEKIMLNHVAEEAANKDSCCEQLSFDMEVSEDDDCISVLQSVYDKVCDLSEEEFSDLLKYLPFDVTVSDDDVWLDEDELQALIAE